MIPWTYVVFGIGLIFYYTNLSEIMAEVVIMISVEL